MDDARKAGLIVARDLIIAMRDKWRRKEMKYDENGDFWHSSDPSAESYECALTDAARAIDFKIAAESGPQKGPANG